MWHQRTGKRHPSNTPPAPRKAELPLTYFYQTTTLTVGPSLFSAASSTRLRTLSGTIDKSCAFTGTTAATCEESVSVKGKHGKNKYTTAYTRTLSGTEITAQPVAITAGGEKLTATASGSCNVNANAGGRVAAGMGAAGLVALGAVAMM